MGKKRIAMAEGCSERFDLDYVRFIAGFEKDNGERTEKLIEKYPNVKVIRSNSRRQAAKFRKR